MLHTLKLDLILNGFICFFFKKKRDERLDKLHTLQRNLLLNGFTLLREGGTLVYSTCSASQASNLNYYSKLN